MRWLFIAVLSALVIGALAGAAMAKNDGAQGAGTGWIAYGGDKATTRYSTLSQITPKNVKKLQQAWTWRHGDLERHPQARAFSGFHATPILLPEQVGRHLILCTPFNRIVALDPATGEERWAFDPKVDTAKFGTRYNCRGVSYWRDKLAGGDAACSHRIFMGTTDRRLWAIDAKTGDPCVGFGDNGHVDITQIMSQSVPDTDYTAAQFVSPPAVVNDVIVLGSTNNGKFKRADAPSGDIRAFDARTGAVRWIFNTVPQSPEDPYYDDWSDEGRKITGGANAWSMMAVDDALDLVYIPTASPGPDFHGGKRPGDNRYANSILAIRGSTGELAWHFQILHHDVWDMDVPASPILVDLAHEGDMVPAVIQLTKQGMVFTFNRETGEPIFPVEERAVPTDGVPGDELSPTQPFPSAPPPLVPHEISSKDAWGLTPYDKGKCRDMLKAARTGKIYTPPSLQGTVFYPGSSGGNNWGGGAFDPEKQILITNVSRLPFYVKLIPAADMPPQDRPPNPMAGMPMGPPGLLEKTDYALEQRPLLGPFFTPCTPPPWAELVAVDMTKGEIKWRSTLGTIDKLSPIPIPLKWGTPTAGGPIVTAGGLAFIGATLDERVRAFDVETGKEVWTTSAPTTCNATPMTYEAAGKQFVVIACGGHMFQYPQGIDDYLIAFALPDA